MQPTITCGVVNNGGTGYWDVMQGCNGYNYQKWGFANDNDMEVYVSQYGWTYVGTGDGQRYFTFNNYDFMMPVNTDTWAVTVSDSGSDFDPWNDYIGTTFSPTAELRVWADDANRPAWQAQRSLESPKPGLVDCVGNGTGTTSVSMSAGLSVPQGSVGVSSTTNVTYAKDGQCNANSDAYSTYMNNNWEGGYFVGPVKHYQMTESQVAWNNITAINGPNGQPDGPGTSGNWVTVNMNYVANFWANHYGVVYSIDLFDDVGCCAGIGANLTYVHTIWYY